MKLHNEFSVFRPTLVEKSNRPGVLMTVGGVYQRGDTENANKRVYPTELWKDVLQRPEVVERLQKRQMVGMLGHPKDGKTDPERISHVVTKQELRSDGTVYGESDVLDTPTGHIVATMFEAGVVLGTSSRGDGSIEKKGGKNEVQQDYQLETYDFVLKPSTPGAFPELIEGLEENEKLIAEAIEGLVKSEDIPKEQRVKVLAECLKILSVLEASNSGDRVQTVSKKIQEELKEDAPTVLVSIQADESVIPELSSPNPKQETTMSANLGQVTTPVLSPDMLTWHQNQVADAVNKYATQSNQEIAGLKDTVIKTQRESTEFRQKLAAAESLIEDFQKEVQTLKESGHTDGNLEERYEAAVSLLDAALERLPELGEAQKRAAALEGLLGAAITNVKSEKVNEAVNSCLVQLPEASRETAKNLLESCDTPEQVAEHFKELMALTRTQPRSATHEPLPPVGGKGINEGAGNTQPNKQVNESKSFVSRLGNRLNAAL